MKITFRSNNRRELINLCIEHTLYVDGFTLKRDYDTLLSNDLRKWKDIKIIVAFVKEKPIAVILLFGIVMFYVKPEYRRKGIATRLFKELAKITTQDLKGTISGEGIKGSISFFKSIDQKYYKRPVKKEKR